MIQYKNISYSAKTFYGIRFEPGEIKAVPQYINNPFMVRVFDENKSRPAKVEEVKEPVIETTRKRKKSNEPEKDSVAEKEIKLEISEEETLNGNPS